MNPVFKNCKIVGDNIASEVYVRQEPGIVHGDPAFVMSRSSLAKFSECPSKFKKSPDEEASSSMEFGTLLDVALLSPDRFDDIYVVAPATYVNDKREEKDWNYNAKFCKEWRADKEAQGKKVIKQSEFDELKYAIEAVAASDFMRGLIGSKVCRKQVMIVGEYHDEATGLVIPVKCLIDVLPDKGTQWERYLADLKTTKSADPGQFEKDIHYHWYDAQAWMFLEMYNSAMGASDIRHPEHRDSFQWALCENTAPFEVPNRHPAIYEGGEFMNLGRLKVVDALKSYCQCLKTGVWPSYNPAPRTLIGDYSYVAEPSPWMNKALLDNIPDFVAPPDPYEKKDDERVDFNN